MKTVLTPKSHRKLGKIVVKKYPFLIGRQEVPFNTSRDYIVAKLSRRHALLVEELGDVYLIDLGSLNGTKVNGEPVRGRAVKLSRGDEIRFAEELVFEVALKGWSKSSPQPQSPPSLTLVPQEVDSEPIEVAIFPFLINELDDKFCGFKENFTNGTKPLVPRAHALLLSRQDEVYIEDLGNPGGTLAGGFPLEKKPVPLHNGDCIAFGKKQCQYVVKLRNKELHRCDEETMLNRLEPSQPAIDINKTTFVATASPFLEILYAKDSDEAAKTKAVTGSQLPAETGRRGKGRALLTRFRNTIADNRLIGQKRIWLAAGAGVLLLVVVSWIYLSGTSRREVKDLLAERHYAESAAIANRYLQRYPRDEQMSALATEALIKYVVPSWSAKLEQKAFGDADQLLARGMNLAQFNPDGQKVLSVLGWVGELEKFFAERGGVESIVIFKDEVKVQDLLERWDRNADDNRRLLNVIVGDFPTFYELRSRSFSHLRTLRSEESIYLKAIEDLKKTIRDKLQEDHAEELAAVFRDFKDKYPAIGGIESLEEDLKHFLAIREAVRARNIPKVLQMLDATTFATPPFQERAREWTATALPPEDIIKAYQRASEAWRSGAISEAITILQPLSQKAWGEVAVRTIERYKKVAADFAELQTKKSDRDYGERLIAFHNSLDPTEDTFFVKAIEADFQTYRDKALSNAEESFKLARQSWNEYSDKGGIRGLMRLEGSVSRSFRQQAQELSEACSHVASATRIYDALHLDYSEEWKTLNERIRGEMKLQRQSLNDLSIVLSPSVLKAKLDLLEASPGCDR